MRERIPTPPEIRREIANECMKELSPLRELGMKARSISPRQMICPPVALDNCIQRLFEKGEDEMMDSDDAEEEEVKRTQGRRHSVHTAAFEKLKVPREHPLLKRLGSGDDRVSRLNPAHPAIVVSHHGPSAGIPSPLAQSGGSRQHLCEPLRAKPASYNLCRRASDGTAAIGAFQQQLREISTLNRIKQLQQEHQKLQEQYQKSLSPCELLEQQALHAEYKQKYEEMREELQKHYEELMAHKGQHGPPQEARNHSETTNQTGHQAPHPLPLLHQFQQLHIENRHNPLRRTPYNQNQHKQVFRTSSYKRAQMYGMLPPLESEAASPESEEDQQEIRPQTLNTSYSMISLWLSYVRMGEGRCFNPATAHVQWARCISKNGMFRGIFVSWDLDKKCSESCSEPQQN